MDAETREVTVLDDLKISYKVVRSVEKALGKSLGRILIDPLSATNLLTFVAKAYDLSEEKAEEKIDKYFDQGGSLRKLNDLIAEKLKEGSFLESQPMDRELTAEETDMAVKIITGN